MQEKIVLLCNAKINTMKLNQLKMNPIHLYLLVALRVIIGWHFLYEGIVKLLAPDWSAWGYLMNSTGFLSGVFKGMAQNDALLSVVDFLNVWGLILIGLGLMLGLFTRVAQFGGIALLSIYYLANPPFASNTGAGFEGSYLLVSKDLIELTALILLSFFRTGKFIGLDGLTAAYFKNRLQLVNQAEREVQPAAAGPDINGIKRREVLRHLATLPILGAFSFGVASKMKIYSSEEQGLADAISGASIKKFEVKNVADLTGELPKGKIKDKVFSKMILGGNLLSGWAHSRDLIYVSSLVRAYHTKQKIFETFRTAEQCGVDTLLSNTVIGPVINEYWNKGYGKMQFIADCAGLNYDGTGTPTPKPYNEYIDIVKKAIDDGATACYIQGETADHYIQHNRIDEIVGAMNLVRDAGLPVGIGAHRIETIMRCVELGLETDFWMKTLHHHNYWSAKHPEWHDNMYCFKPEETISFMNALPQPWIAFKILAAGALRPEEAFRYAYQNGADFICVGMYDFQVVDNVNTALAALSDVKERQRPWMA
jgi:uncharacterized membrane protein YphA (DoxX/SURF4 family)